MNKKIKSILSYIFEIITFEKNQKRIRSLNLIFSLLCLVFISQILFEYLNQEKFEFRFDFLAAILIFLSYVLTGVIWSRYMKSNYQGNLFNYFFNWSHSSLGKYFFAGLLSVTIRLDQKDFKNNPKKLFYGFLEEQFLVSLFSIPALLFYIFLDISKFKILILLVLFLISLNLIRKIYLTFKIDIISMFNQPLLLYINAVLQVLIFYTIAINLNYNDPLYVAVLYLISTNIGLFFVGVPAGVGIREFIFLFVTNNYLSNVELLDFIITSRVLLIVNDLLFGVVGMIVNKNNLRK